jgi:hypothetical protein
MHPLQEEMKGAFPSVARLTAERRFWAVRNLVRRRVIDDEEALGTHQGKTAIDWAEFHDEFRLEKELRYFFVRNFVSIDWEEVLLSFGFIFGRFYFSFFISNMR